MKKEVIIAIVIIVVLALIGAAAVFLIKSNDSIPVPVVYEQVEVNALFDALKDDILVAGEYKDKSVEVSGNVCLVNPDENYVNISIPNNSLVVFCRAISAEQSPFINNCNMFIIKAFLLHGIYLHHEQVNEIKINRQLNL